MGTKESVQAFLRSRRVNWRYAGIWFALLGLVIVCLVIKPTALNAISRQAIFPLAAFVAIVSMGQALVIRMRGIDLSVPGVMAVSSLMIRFVGGGANGSTGHLVLAIVIALLISTLVGLINGLLVAVAKLSPLIVTLAMGSVIGGFAAWFEAGHSLKTSVPDTMADFGKSSLFGLNSAVYVAVAMIIITASVLVFTSVGRRYTAVGTNSVAARIAGVPVVGYQVVGYTVASVFYGIGGILLAGFLGTPTLGLGETYLLTPIVAVVLAGGALSGGGGSMLSIAGAALFLGLLRHLIAALGLPSSSSSVLEGIFVIVGMGFASVEMGAPAVEMIRRRWRSRGSQRVVAVARP